jgi:hypothetical protein
LRSIINAEAIFIMVIAMRWGVGVSKKIKKTGKEKQPKKPN